MTPTAKSISVSCSCRASVPGEAVRASVRRRDLSVARGPLSKKCRVRVVGRGMLGCPLVVPWVVPIFVLDLPTKMKHVLFCVFGGCPVFSARFATKCCSVFFFLFPPQKPILGTQR